MVRRTSKENEEEVNYQERNMAWGRWLGKARANAQLGEFKQIVLDFPARIEPEINRVSFNLYPQTEERCAVCDGHINNSLFPEDYPKEFKFCCSCRAGIEYIILPSEVQKRHIDVCSVCRRFIKRYRKIFLKTVTVFG